MVIHRLNFCKWGVGILIVVLIFFYGINDTYGNEHPKKIVLINSYHKGLSWTDEETNGVMNILKCNENKCSVAVEYMDWKRYPTEENINNLYTQLQYKYAGQKIDLVVTTDDAALTFALENRGSIFSNAPIVFCGVNEKDVLRILKGATKVTGVVEKVDPDKTIEAALEINPEIKQIYVVFDNTESGQSTGALTIEAIRKINPDIEVKTSENKRFEDILDDVSHASKDSIIVITTYYSDIENTVVGFEESSKIISQYSAVPVYHLYEFGMGNGAIGGSMLSGSLQGEEAGKIAHRILEGESTDKIPVKYTQTTRYIFDYDQLMRFGISEEAVPEESEIINEPFSFFETYKSIVITTCIIFLLLVSFICMLLFYIRKIRKMKQELEEKNDELSMLNTDLTVSDNKLRQQYAELVKMQENLIVSEKQYSLLFEKMLNGFFIFEPVLNKDKKLVDIRFINVNPGFENQTNIKVRNILEKTWMEAFGYPNQELSIYEKVLQTGEAERFETYYSEVNTYYLVNAFKVSDEQVGVIFDNISEYRMAIKEIRKLNEELEHRVAERTGELQQAVDELESFTYTVSHDLKSPLRAIEGYSRIMDEDYGEELEEDAIEILHNIRTICRDMLNMIHKLLQYSVTSRTDLCKEEINIKEMFLSVFHELKLANQERDIRFIIETGLPNVYADRILLKQVIYNVLSNGIKFTKDVKQSRIIVGNTITSDEYIFYVKDNGIGFDMEYSGKLFGIFQRLHTSDEFEGSGIGLVTVKKIIQKHGGRTWIEGEMNKGATIYFTLPFSW